ncbi:MAG: 2Fe-2S iron-sulfur cluster-binding protein [Bacteroidales bacterium]|nr:2Fe-2S iron-sulfur cluster-binding protein [Bacteroidales bacterium]
MAEVVRFFIDGKECMAKNGDYLLQAAKENGIYIPTLCHYDGLKPKGSCRVCTCKVNGRLMTACTTPIAEGMMIESNTLEIEEMRKSIIELFFVDGNHFCPTCEKSGYCELQALAYRYRITAPRYPFLFPLKRVVADYAKIIIDHNRCVLCKRCVRAIKDEMGKSFFAYRRRGQNIEVILDKRMSDRMSFEIALEAENICPVGAIMAKRTAFTTPIGYRKFDKITIGSDIEKIKTK